MPLIEIWTQPVYYPLSNPSRDSPKQKTTSALASALPGLLVANTKKLHLDADTPEAGVQVTHHKFSSRDINTPHMWIKVIFSEDPPPKKVRIKVKTRLEKIILGWFEENNLVLPDNYACDIFWGPTHGFLRINGVSNSW